MIPLALPHVTDADLRAVAETMQSGWLTTGAQVQAFEKELAAPISAFRPVDAIAVSSATAGLHLALEAAQIRPGDKVLVPTWTFTATAHAVELAGATPVFCDVDLNTLNMTPATVKPFALKVQAAIPVHMAGLVANVDGIKQTLNVPIIEDAAHALGARHANEKQNLVGSYYGSHAVVFSFYATKNITTMGEGGAVICGHADHAARVRRARYHGLDREVWGRHAGGNAEFAVIDKGYKYNMSDVSAAMGRTQLMRLEAYLSERKRLAMRYNTAFINLDMPFNVPLEIPGRAWHLYQIITRDADDATKLIAHLRERNIATGVHYRPLHQAPYWKTKYNLYPQMFPNAEALAGRVVSLPLYPQLGDADQDRVIDAVANFFRPRT